MKLRRLILVTAALALYLVPRTSAGEDAAATEREIRDLEYRFEQAVLKADIEFFERVLADDFTHTTQSGKFRNRQEWLANHKAGQSNYDALNVDQLAIRSYGDTSVVTARIAPQGRDANGKPIEGQYRFLRVWVKEGDAWKVVAFQSTRIADPGSGGRP